MHFQVAFHSFLSNLILDVIIGNELFHSRTVYVILSCFLVSLALSTYWYDCPLGCKPNIESVKTLGPVALKVWKIIIPFNDPDTDKRDQLNFAGMAE